VVLARVVVVPPSGSVAVVVWLSLLPAIPSREGRQTDEPLTLAWSVSGRVSDAGHEDESCARAGLAKISVGSSF
jgi:hypothetical protein